MSARWRRRAIARSSGAADTWVAGWQQCTLVDAVRRQQRHERGRVLGRGVGRFPISPRNWGALPAQNGILPTPLHSITGVFYRTLTNYV